MLAGWRGVLMLATVAACVIAPVRAVQADLVVTGTRFIYPAGQKSLTLRTGNTGQHPILVQSWLDSGDFTADPSRETVPFLLTPPVFRLDPTGRMSLLLRHTGEPMPKDRESVFWINFLEVPARDPSQKNLLQLAVRLRMKVLYRPEGLPGSASEAIGKVAWTYHAADREIEAHNETPYFVSLARVELEADAGAGGGSPITPITPITLTGLTVAPLARTRFSLPAGAAPRLGEAALRYYAANDDGEIIEARAALRRGNARGTQ
ncbi:MULTISPECIES: fimbria/pilus periplasmic chaperone [Achromobacter]|uniref:Fimbria/pilus periplasmic chaperone n=1 Tax=Achromobacter spanius TaxID=217203 RepID=A0ABY8H0W9_9BURK|nr:MULTISPECIES: fimbria/pilus periplasmic chaperone [Achromobacter]WAI85809.1 fimbria/pilus periplasmic chaperone [Achromobacter spanius]WEX95890.1 fimbria/pilus periplasmic chaperone [Achromobacter sp. SS2-2022]WFP10389.1 fimbria/pilus periplasmic chaperone [Achromobacter spanius]